MRSQWSPDPGEHGTQPDPPIPPASVNCWWFWHCHVVKLCWCWCRCHQNCLRRFCRICGVVRGFLRYFMAFHCAAVSVRNSVFSIATKDPLDYINKSSFKLYNPSKKQSVFKYIRTYANIVKGSYNREEIGSCVSCSDYLVKSQRWLLIRVIQKVNFINSIKNPRFIFINI